MYAIVIFEQQAPLLLGQSAIKKLGNFTISNNKLILNNQQSNSYNQNLEDVYSECFILFDEEKYKSIIKKLQPYQYSGALNTIGYYLLLSSKNKIGYTSPDVNYEIINEAEQWVLLAQSEGVPHNYKYYADNIYRLRAFTYYMLDQYDNALLAFEEYLAFSEVDDTPLIYSDMAECYRKLGNNIMCDRYYDKAIKQRCLEIGINPNDAPNYRNKDNIINIIYSQDELYTKMQEYGF